MLDFTFWSPTKFIFGRDAESQTGEQTKQFGGSNVLIHYGGQYAEKSGLLARVESSLQQAGVRYEKLGGVQPNPLSGLVYQGIKLAKSKKIDFILAVGGGSVIDSAKAIAFGAKQDHDFWDNYKTGQTPAAAIPLGVVLTIPAAGSEGSPDTVVTNEDGMYKRAVSGDILRPRFSILNPELTFTLPPWQTAAGSVDIMAHVMERYFTNEKDVEITDRLCEGILKAMITEAPKVLANPTDYEARANIMWAGTVAHNNVCGVGRQPDWGSHNIEHELSAKYGLTHGAGLAIIFPAWMRYVYKHNIPRFCQFAMRVLNCDYDYENPEVTALEGIARIEAFFVSIGMPTRINEVEGAKYEDIEFLAHHTDAGDGKSHLGNMVPLYEADIAKILRIAYK